MSSACILTWTTSLLTDEWPMPVCCQQEHNCTGVHGVVSYHDNVHDEDHDHEAYDEDEDVHVGAFGCLDGILLVYGNGSSIHLPTATRVGCKSSLFMFVIALACCTCCWSHIGITLSTLPFVTITTTYTTPTTSLLPPHYILQPLFKALVVISLALVATSLPCTTWIWLRLNPRSPTCPQEARGEATNPGAVSRDCVIWQAACHSKLAHAWVWFK